MNKKILAILLCTSQVWGAIAIDVQKAGGEADAASGLTWSHTMGAGANNALVVCVDVYYTSGGAPTATYAGQSLTQETGGKLAGGDNYYTYIFYGYGLPTGANNVVLSGAANSYWLANSTSFTGAFQGSPDNITAFVTAAGLSQSISITPVAANAFAIDCAGTQTSTVLTQGAWGNMTETKGTAAFSIASSYTGPVSTAQTNTYTASFSVQWGDSAITIAPASTLSILTIKGGQLVIK